MAEGEVTDRIATAADLPSDRAVRREMWLQRIGIAVLLALTLAAAFNTFGPRTTTEELTGERGSVQVEFPSITRPGLATEVVVTFSPDEPMDTYVLAIDQDAITDLGIAQIYPEPTETTARGSQVVLEFEGSEADTFEVVLNGRLPTQQPMGSLEWRLAWLNDGAEDSLDLRTVLLP